MKNLTLLCAACVGALWASADVGATPAVYESDAEVIGVGNYLSVDRMPNIPYFIVCDMKDEIFPEKDMDDYVARLKKRCRSVEYVKLPNQRHGGFTPEARRRLHDFVCKPPVQTAKCGR